MGEPSIWQTLSGPTGGLIAFGALLGIGATWAVNIRIFSPILARAHAAEISAMQARIEAMELAFRSELASLRARVQELEATEAEYHKILKLRAKLEDES